jgi:UDP-2,3-diacylglucosamine hydrolase
MEDTPLGIIAGGGDLPFAIAESVRESGRGVFVVALTGSADDWVNNCPHEWASLGEVGKVLKALRANAVKDLVLAGKLNRPKFSEVKLDAKGVLVAPRIIAAARHGDDALLRSILDLMEREGFHAVGSAEAAPGLLVPAGVMGRGSPSKDDEEDIATAFKIVRAMGSLDIGQAAVVCEGLTLAVEAAEGTDAMIARVGTLSTRIRGTPEDRRGVLVKAPKPTQDLRADLPVIGVQTVRNAAAAGLSGIAVEAGGALILGKRAVVDEADKLGLFLVGVPG